ncbi:MAG: VCBS repeat-containing protein [Candidatus Taylorbacteria bacterium]|nr:VCBS repeat-containing protein [Candidatus Taylorbacteria bacterium]
MKKRYKILLSCVFLLILTGILFLFFRNTISQDKVTVPVSEKTTIATTTSVMNGYTIEFVRSSYLIDSTANWSKILILKNDNIVFQDDRAEEFSGFYSKGVGDWITDVGELKSKALKDITGDGKPELVFTSYSGGSHCCSHNYIIGLTDPIHFYLNLDTGDSGIVFKDLNHDGKMEIETYEDIFAYWHTSFGASPMPRVVLSLQDDVYKPDTKLIRESAPPDAEIRAKAAEVTSWSGAAGPDVSWKYAIDLIYSGNIISARKYVDLAWRENGEFKTKEEFWQELTDQIHKSPYYSDLHSYFGI